jgi:deazaflavin-dependent oxidoreductase (nitroreductase family)
LISNVRNDLDDEQFCYVTTIGRRTGRSHTIEIWFGRNEDTIYMLSGGADRSDWVKNIRANGNVTVRIGREMFVGSARVVEDSGEDAAARRLLGDKYGRGQNLTRWLREALPVAIDLRSGERVT